MKTKIASDECPMFDSIDILSNKYILEILTHYSSYK